MARAEYPHQREQSPGKSWTSLKPADWSKIPHIDDGQIGWRPNQMPNNILINVDEVNKLLATLELPNTIEIQQLTQKPDHQLAVGGMDGQGNAVASRTGVASKLKDAHLSRHLDVDAIQIDFDKLLSQAIQQSHTAQEQKTIYANLIDDAFRHGLQELALSEMQKRLNQDILYLTGIAAAVFGAYELANAAEQIVPEIPEIMMFVILLINFVMLSKFIAFMMQTKPGTKSNEEFREQVTSRAGKRFIEEGKNLEQIEREENNALFWREVLKVPFLQSAKQVLALTESSIQKALANKQFFRAA